MPKFATVKDIEQELDLVLKSASDLVQNGMLENRDFTDDETEKHQELLNEASRLRRMKARLEAQLEEENAVAEARARDRAVQRQRTLANDPDEIERRQNEAYDTWLRFGPTGLNSEQRAAMAVLRPPELRGGGLNPQSVGSDQYGGYLVPPGFQRELERAMLAFGGVMSVARILRTSTGNDLEWPSINDTGQTGSLLSENATVTVSDMTFGSTTFNAYKFTSGLIKVSNELLQDSAFDLNEFLRDALSERIARGLNAYLTTGTGSSQPRGCVTASTASGQTSTANLPTFDQMLAFFHSVDPAYRTNGTFMMADDSLMAVRKIRTYDGTNYTPEFAFQEGVSGSQPGTILGRPYVINQSMANDTTSTNKWCLFGDFSKYIVRQALGVEIVRLVERYADAYQTGFIGFARYDGDLINAGTNPLKTLAVA